FAGTILLPGMFCARLDLNGNWIQVKPANLFLDYGSPFGSMQYNDFSADSTGRLYIAATENTQMVQDEDAPMKSWHKGYFAMLDSSFSNRTSCYENPNKTYGLQADAVRNGGSVFSMTQEISGHYRFKIFKTDALF